jgi:type IX secretion system PorP/SprF family membrane protein
MTKFQLFISFIFFGGCSFMNAQQVALTTQYDLISNIQNPAYNGLNRMLKVDAISRVQWANFPGTPRYTAVAFQSPVNKDFAMGANFQTLQVGKFKTASPLNLSTYSCDLAFHQQLQKNLHLAAGLRVGLMSFSMRISQLSANVPTDIAQLGNDYSFQSPLVGGGMMVYGKNYFVGMSMPQFAIVSDRLVENVNLGYNARSFYNINAGYIYELNKDWFAKITSQVRWYEGMLPVTDANLYFGFNDLLTVGYGYRTTKVHAFLTKVRLNDFFNVVYAFESGKVYDNQTPFNSQEFGLSYQLNNNKTKIKVVPRKY